MSGILEIGFRSLLAYHAAIKTTAQNLENAHTPFYSRKQIQLVEAMFNNGVQISDVNRIFDEVANNNLLDKTSQVSGINKLYEKISDFEKVLDSDGTNINKYINDSLKSLQELNSSVGSTQSRSAFLSQLSSLANKIRNTGEDVSRRQSENSQDIKRVVANVNDALEQIKDINISISKMDGGDYNALLDQQNALLHNLAKYMDFKTSKESNGMVSVSLSNGMEIVSASNYKSISVLQDAQNPSKVSLTCQNTTITNLINSGEIASMLNYQNDALDFANAGISRLSLGLVSMFNQQNHVGIDWDGNFGGDLFADVNSIALQLDRVIKNTNNSGSASIQVVIDDTNALTLSDYKMTFVDATHFEFTRLSDHKLISTGDISSLPVTLSTDGFTVDVSSATAAAGDSYIISPTRNASQKINLVTTDPKKLALAFPVTAQGSNLNRGQGEIKIDQMTDINNANFSISKQLNPPIKIEFLTDTTYQLINLNTNAIFEGPINYTQNNNDVFPTPNGFDPGFRVSLRGNVNAGDVFTLNYNTNTAGDNRNALEFGKLYTKKIFDNGSMNLNEVYQHISNTISLKAYSAKVELDSAVIQHEQAEERFSQVSGVSELEEMSSLVEFQQAYQSSAQVIQAAKMIFETIISMAR